MYATDPTIHVYALCDPEPLFLTDGDVETGHGDVYVLRDLPPEEKPREKLLRYGPGALKVNELLAIVLGRGTKKEDVLSMATHAIAEYGEKGLASERNAAKIARDLGLTELKASQIVACFELGRRFFERNPHGLAVIRTPQDVFEYARAKGMGDLTRENLRGLYLNVRREVVRDELISIGTINRNIADPREVFKPAFEHGAVGVVLVHNHPSGGTAPSPADLEITRELIQAGKLMKIELIDHVIVTKDAFGSILHPEHSSNIET